jgi:hypothetical protein
MDPLVAGAKTARAPQRGAGPRSLAKRDHALSSAAALRKAGPPVTRADATPPPRLIGRDLVGFHLPPVDETDGAPAVPGACPRER